MGTEESFNSIKRVLRKESFNKREKTLMKNTRELAALCDIPTLMICFGPDETISTWPENKKDVRDIITRYRGLSLQESGMLSDCPEQNVVNHSRTAEQGLDKMSCEDAVKATRSMDSTLHVVRERIKFLTCQNNSDPRCAALQNDGIEGASLDNRQRDDMDFQVAGPTSETESMEVQHGDDTEEEVVAGPTSETESMEVQHGDDTEEEAVAEPTSEAEYLAAQRGDDAEEVVTATSPNCKRNTKTIRLFGKDVTVSSHRSH